MWDLADIWLCFCEVLLCHFEIRYVGPNNLTQEICKKIQISELVQTSVD